MSIGRNDSCHCGSGKKYKKCCLQIDENNEKLEKEKDKTVSIVDDLIKTQNDNTLPQEQFEKVKSDSLYDDVPEEFRKIVKEWWDKTNSLWDSRDGEIMLQHVMHVMNEQKAAFVYLGLEETEYIFEMGGDLIANGKEKEYAKFLNEYRTFFPEYYSRSYGYFDNELILQCILNNDSTRIPEYLNNYINNPVSQPDSLDLLLKIFAWTENDSVLKELVDKCVVPICESDQIFNDSFILDWLVFSIYIPYLCKGEHYDESAKFIIRQFENSGVTNLVPPTPEIAIDYLKKFDNLPKEWVSPPIHKKMELAGFYSHVGSHFCAYLHNVGGFSWCRSYLLSDQISSYLIRCESKSKKESFPFTEKLFSDYIKKSLCSFLSLDEISPIALLEGIYYFSQYLTYNNIFTKDQCIEVQNLAEKLFYSIIKEFPTDEPALRLMKVFRQFSYKSK